MSLLAAFTAMLGKQWLTRYLRHSGGSVVERSGDRQCKFDGLEKWSFRLFIEALPLMLQIALLLLMSGLSRYMWSINTSVAWVIISSTALGILFYIGIVAAGTHSYECPFQTPVSIGLRHLRDSTTTQKLLANLYPSKVTSLIYAIWEASLSPAVSKIHSAATRVGHQTIILFLQIDQAIRDAKLRLVQGIQRVRHVRLLSTTTNETHNRLPPPQDILGLQLGVSNLEVLQRQNVDNAHCVSWVLHNITDPEAIDSAIHLAGTIQWFDGDPNHDPPFTSIVSTFEACFDSTGQLYPGMRDRAYFSARAILQISMRARGQSHKHASKYPIVAIPSSSSQHTDPDLHHIILMLELNLHNHNSHLNRPNFDFPRVNRNTDAHSLWMSNLLVDLTHVGPNPILHSYLSYIGAAKANHQGVIANTLLMWYMFLGGQIKEEVPWVVDKSYVVISLSFLSAHLIYSSDSLQTILSHLGARVMNAFSDENCFGFLEYLLEFLAAWEERPTDLTQVAYQWCSAISEVAGRLAQRETPNTQPHSPPFQQQVQLRRLEFERHIRYFFRLPQNTLLPDSHILATEREFSDMGPSCDAIHSGGTPHHIFRSQLGTDLSMYLLPMTLEIAFRLVVPGHDQPDLHLPDTSHDDWVFETAFSSDDDEIIADAVCAWIGDNPPASSCAHYFARRVGIDEPFSKRLRQLSIHAIEHIWHRELEGSMSETVSLLNHLKVGLDEMGSKEEWGWLLARVISLPTGPESLSSHYWHLLGQPQSLMMRECWKMDPVPFSVVTRSLEKAKDWEKLETWMVVAWLAEQADAKFADIEQVTYRLLSQQPPALLSFEELLGKLLEGDQKVKLQEMCNQVRTEQTSLGFPPM